MEPHPLVALLVCVLDESRDTTMWEQIRRAVAWQATTIAAIALLIGLPAGVAGGRWAWRVFAAQLGVLPEPAVPLTTIFIAIPAALALANLIAAAPGQAAARTKSATVLRTE